MADTSWEQTLATVEQSVADCLAALDQYEATFAGVMEPQSELRGSTPPSSPPVDDGWDARLRAARASAEEIDRLLVGSEAGWSRWRESCSAWRRAIEQTPAVPPEEVVHVEGRGDPAGGG